MQIIGSDIGSRGVFALITNMVQIDILTTNPMAQYISPHMSYHIATTHIITHIAS